MEARLLLTAGAVTLTPAVLAAQASVLDPREVSDAQQRNGVDRDSAAPKLFPRRLRESVGPAPSATECHSGRRSLTPSTPRSITRSRYRALRLHHAPAENLMVTSAAAFELAQTGPIPSITTMRVVGGQLI